MNEDQMERREGIRLEQHIGTILQILVVALLGWSLITTQNMTVDMARLKDKVDSLTIVLNQGTNDRYRGSDAAKDFSAIRSEMQFLERRVSALETSRK